MITRQRKTSDGSDSLRMPPTVAGTQMTSTVRGGRSHSTVLITMALILSGLFGGFVLAGSPERARAETLSVGPELVVNGTFETGVGGWRTNQSYTSLAVATSGHSGSRSAVLTTPAGTNAVLN